MWVLVPSKTNLSSRLELALHIIPVPQPKFLWMSLRKFGLTAWLELQPYKVNIACLWKLS